MGETAQHSSPDLQEGPGSQTKGNGDPIESDDQQALQGRFRIGPGYLPGERGITHHVGLSGDYILCIASICLFALYAPRRKRFGLRLGVGAALSVACVALVMCLVRLVPEAFLLSYLRFSSVLVVALGTAIVYSSWEVSIGKLLLCTVCGCALQNMGSNLRPLVKEYITDGGDVRELLPMLLVFVGG